MNNFIFLITVRFAQFRPPLLALKPIFFQVPQQEAQDVESQFFWGRSWIFRELTNHLLPPAPLNSQTNSQLDAITSAAAAAAAVGTSSSNSSGRGVIISGATGSGKTSIALQLVEYSCFGRSRIPVISSPPAANNRNENAIYESPYAANSLPADSIYAGGRNSTPAPPAADVIPSLAARVVAYHFCQVRSFIAFFIVS